MSEPNTPDVERGGGWARGWEVTEEVELEQARRFEHGHGELHEVVVAELQAPKVLQVAQIDVQF